MPPKFGTSGLRGLVTELSTDLVQDHIRAFISACETGNALFVGQDLRPSSPDLAHDIIKAAQDMGLNVVDCGALPTPALALAALQAKGSAVMVTGSHIPADRNGLKFYTPKGEITKANEAAILAALGQKPNHKHSQVSQDHDAAAQFTARYVTAFGQGALQGRKVGLYSHSAVGRDILAAILRDLGAEVIELGRSSTFIPVDTEAVDPQTAAQIKIWVAEHGLDALVSTDGDSDRPLLADENGQVIPGDIIGQITAKFLGADHVVTPISSNSGVLQKGFAKVYRTKIGSPYVIEAMENAGGKVVGYEANGGFLLGFSAQAPAGILSQLPTRDCILPLLSVLYVAGAKPLSALIANEPNVVTLSDRLQNIASDRSAFFLQKLISGPDARHDLLSQLVASEASHDLTDGLRLLLTDGRILHLRPSGNAPEFRVYVEASTRADAQTLLQQALSLLSEKLQS